MVIFQVKQLISGDVTQKYLTKYGPCLAMAGSAWMILAVNEGGLVQSLCSNSRLQITFQLDH
jgi:hypothetical protein